MDGGGGFLALAEEEATGAVEAGISLYLVWLSLPTHSFAVLWLSMPFLTDTLFSFSGVRFVEVQQLETDGLHKIELAGAGLEAEGL